MLAQSHIYVSQREIKESAFPTHKKYKYLHRFPWIRCRERILMGCKSYNLKGNAVKTFEIWLGFSGEFIR